MTDFAALTMRPMNLGELLDKAIRLYRQNFLKFIGIYAIPYVPLTLIQAGLSFLTTSSMLRSGTGNPGLEFLSSTTGLLTVMGSFLIVFVQFIFVQGVATAALTRAVANNYTGRPVGILDSYRTLSTSWVKLILALIFVFILVLALFVWMIVPCVGWLSGPGILFFISLAVSPLIPPVITLENAGVFESIRRAWDLARSRFWWLIGCVLILVFFGWLIVSGPMYLLSWLAGYVTSALPSDLGFQTAIASVMQTLITMSLSLLYVPLKLTSMTVIYFDLRTRSEGLDLALQMSASTASENEVITLPQITDKTPMPLITGIDVGRFALLSLIGVAAYGLLFVLIFGIFGLAVSAF